jgi:hypothetical protein
MLDAIRAAQNTITFETFIYWQGRSEGNSPTPSSNVPERV